MTKLAQSAAPKSAEALIRAARARSNRGIAERNPHMVAESLDKDFVVIIGDGTFVPTRDAYIALFKQDFANPTRALRYERIPDTIDVSTADPIAAEHGHWIALTSTGATAYTGTYSAMWRRTPSGWKLRSELFVTLTKAKSD